MAHYRLIHEYTTPQFHNVCGRAFSEDGKEVAVHTSSNLAWLEQDLLLGCNYNPEKGYIHQKLVNMAHYIDADRLRAEIDRIEEDARKVRVSGTDKEAIGADGKVKLCLKLKSLIDSLQQEQPCLPFNVNEAAENYYEQDCPYPGEARVVNNEHDVWFPSQAIEDAFIAGAKWMAEQGETQEHFVIGTIADSPCGPAIVCYTNEFEIGDKVIIQIRKKD